MNATPPRPIQLVRSDFPPDKCFDGLVAAINQFSNQTVQAINVAQTVYRDLNLSTSATVANLFPLDIKSPGFTPREVRVAQPPAGTTDACSVVWRLLANGDIRITNITGLPASSSISLRLAID